jgi:hypothetical protein
MNEEKLTIIISDRYSATGIPRPDPQTVCGQCDGMGFVPIYMSTDVKVKKNRCFSEDEKDPRFIALWKEAHRYYRIKKIIPLLKNPFKMFNWKYAFELFDGYHFVTCPDCGGTRKRAADIKEMGGTDPQQAKECKPVEQSE